MVECDLAMVMVEGSNHFICFIKIFKMLSFRMMVCCKNGASMIDERLSNLIDKGAELTIKIRRSNVFVQAKIYDGNVVHRASAGTLEKAIDRLCASVSSDNVSIKKARRQKERLKREIMENIIDYESSLQT